MLSVTMPEGRWVVNGERLDGITQTFGHYYRAVAGRSWHDHRELFTAITSGKIAGPEKFA